MSVSDITVPIKSQSDDRSYRAFTIAENNLQVLLCSDSKADKSGAALACNVGSFSDLPEALGLAHFLEHMLFLGTEKYPDESEFSASVSAAGGSNNAWTDSEHTVYYFNCASPHLNSILDRFAQFFIGPLFTQSATEREMNAVHSEHQKNIYSDGWRSHEIIRQAMDQDHPASRFHTGDLETLQEIPTKNGLDLRQVMLDFHATYYSSNMMRLVVIGKESLDDLQSYVLDHFTSIQNKDTPQPSFPCLTLPKGGCVLESVPTQEKRSLRLTWILPSDNEYWQSAPLSLMSHLLGDESPGSLLSLLKDCDLALALSSGTGSCTSCYSSLSVSISLTPRGMQRTHDVLRLVYAYIDLINSSSDEELQRVATELQLIDTMNFRFKAKSSLDNYITSLVMNMYKYPSEYYIQGDDVATTVDIPTFRKFSSLFTLENCVIYVSAKDVSRDIPLIDVKLYADKDDGYLETIPTPAAYADADLPVEELNREYTAKQWSYEKWYKMRFTKYYLDDENIAYIHKGIIPELDSVKGKPADQLLNLPAPNPFIPTVFDVITTIDEDISTPEFEEIKDYPLSIDTKNDENEQQSNEFMNSVTDLSPLRQILPVYPHQGQRFSPESLRDTIKGLIDDNLIGFDREHVNDLVNNKDELYESIVTRILGDVGTEQDAFLPAQEHRGDMAPAAAGDDNTETKDGTTTTHRAESATDGGDEGTDDYEGNTEDYTDCTDDDDYTEDGEDDSQNDSNSNAAQKPPATSVDAKFTTIDELFSDERTANQWIPPALVPVPIKQSAFTYLNADESSKMPHLPPVELWHKLSTSYKLPNVYVRIRLNYPSIPYPILSLLALTISEGVNERLYSAIVCGVSYSITNDFDSIIITVRGHRQTVAATVAEIIRSYHQVNAELVDNRRDILLRSLRSIDSGDALTQAHYHASAFVVRNILHHREKIDEIKKVKVDDVVAAARLVKNAVVLVNGNVSQSYAVRIAQFVVQGVGCTSLPVASFRLPGSVRPQGELYSLWNHGNPKDEQNGIRTTYFITPPLVQDKARGVALIKSVKHAASVAGVDAAQATHTPAPSLGDIASGKALRQLTHYGLVAYAQVLGQLLDEHVFDQLRTKQQLGYLVYSSVYPTHAGYLLAFQLQSSVHPALVDHRIETYLRKTLRSFITNMTTKQWCAQVAGRHASSLSSFNNIQSESNHYWDEINSRRFDFTRSLIVPFLLQHTHRHVFLSLLKSTLYDANRSKLSFHVIASSETNNAVSEEEYTRYRPATVCHDEEIYGMKPFFPSYDH